MAWKFDPMLLDLVWTEDSVTIADSVINLGALGSDLTIDAGMRENDSSVIDQGFRV